MLTIWKYVIKEPQMSIRVPAPAVALSVQFQSGGDPENPSMAFPCVWAIVDPKKPTIPINIWVVGTGNPIQSEITHDEEMEKKYPEVYEESGVLLGALTAKHHFVGTVQSETTPNFVWHIFWKKMMKEEEAN